MARFLTEMSSGFGYSDEAIVLSCLDGFDLIFGHFMSREPSTKIKNFHSVANLFANLHAFWSNLDSILETFWTVHSATTVEVNSVNIYT